jgi:hypothetical protein
MSRPPDKSGTTTGQIRWRSLEIIHGPDNSGPPDKFGGGTRLAWYPSLEAGKPALESGGFIGQVR